MSNNLSSFHSIQTTKELLARILNLIKLDHNMEIELDLDEDYLIATLILDYMDFPEGNKLADRIK